MTAATTESARVRRRPPAWLYAFIGHEMLVLAAVLLPLPAPSAQSLRLHMAFSPQAHFLYQWDSLWFQAIAVHGYQVPGAGLRATVFFPLLPLVLRLVGPIVGLMVQQAALAAVFWLLDRVFGRFNLAGTARVRALWLFAVNPAAIYYSALYAETWMLLGALASIELAYGRRYGEAALVGFLASLTEAPAVVLGLIPLVLAAWRVANQTRRDVVGIVGWGVGIGAGIAAYAGYLGLMFGRPLAFMAEQKSAYWRGTFQAPWSGWIGPFLPGHQLALRHDPIAVVALFCGATLLAAGGVAAVSRLTRERRDWMTALGAYTAAMLVLAFSFGTHGLVYHSTLRFLSPVFPVYMGLARLSPWAYRAVSVVFVVLAVAGGALFSHSWFFQ